MGRTFEVSSCAVIACLALAGCPGGKSGTGTNTQPTGPNGQPAKSGELDKLMRTKMNKSYSQLVYLVFHSDGGPDFAAISQEGARLSDAIAGVLKLPMPPMVQSDQARSIYLDYNNTLWRDNEKFAEATSRQDLPTMSAALTKIGDTCSACHHFFRVKIKDQAE
jgi:hypothetical protein